MRRVMNEMFEISIDDQGTVRELYLRQDPEGMNWVIDPDYLQSVGYPDEDKCFGRFILETNGHHYTLDDVEPVNTDKEDSVTVSSPFGEVQVHQCYSLS